MYSLDILTDNGKGKATPMLIVGTNRQRNVRIGENCQVAIRLWCYSSTLYVLVAAISNVYRRVTSSLE